MARTARPSHAPSLKQSIGPALLFATSGFSFVWSQMQGRSVGVSAALPLCRVVPGHRMLPTRIAAIHAGACPGDGRERQLWHGQPLPRLRIEEVEIAQLKARYFGVAFGL